MIDNELRSVLDQIPVGITVTDLDGRILYYNESCARIVDRKPEYIGKDIRSCHKKSESITKIDTLLSEIKNGKRENYCYESRRKDKVLSVTISPYKSLGELIGFIQSIVVK
ncbi:MAG: PAS domain-containing protein [Deltaproteobacteria bacterium]|nr:PAS domain-containing protein [Deltaproteobacteria bacterium]